MINPDLTAYIKQELARGVSAGTIRATLMREGGWTPADLDQTFAVLNSTPPPFTPVPQSPIQTAQVTPTLTKTHHTHRGILIALLIIVLFIGGTAAYGYVAYINVAPEKVISKMVTKIRTVAGYAFSFDSKITFPGNVVPTAFSPQTSEASEQSVTISMSGNVNTREESTDSDIVMHAETTLLPLDLSIPIKTVDNTFYIQVPNIGALTSMIGTIKPGDWLSLSKTDMEKIIAEYPEVATNFNIDQSALDPSTFVERRAEIIAAIAESGVLVITEEFPKTTLDGTFVHHYGWSADFEKLKALLPKILELQGKSPTAISSTAIENFIDATEPIEGEIWIGVQDALPYKIIFTLKSKPTDSVQQNMSVTTTLTFGSYGPQGGIEAPANSQSVYTLLKSSLDTAKLKSQDAIIKSHLSSIRAYAELSADMHEGSYASMCIETGGLLDAINEVNEVIAPQALTCEITGKSYRVFAPLVVDPTKFFCVDSAGNAIELSGIPLGPLCL